jgi:outer membrane receptor protein involved in Fe transport
MHVAYSHQFVEGRGAISGGLTSFEPPSEGFFFLDHDQRDTLTWGGDVEVAPGIVASGSVAYGSGFLQGDGPDHKPAHATVSAELSKTMGKQWTVMVTALNLGNTHFLLDESNTFGGTHFNSPRQIALGLRYRFHY